jgi:hypothetical protein
MIVATLSALGLNSRIDDLSKAQTAAESRLSTSITATETRLSGRLDKLSDQFTKVDERTATLEGGRGASISHGAKASAQR